jgi:hypothetical protein
VVLRPDRGAKDSSMCSKNIRVILVALAPVGCFGVDPQVDDLFAVPGSRGTVDARAEGGIGRPVDGVGDGGRTEAATNEWRDGGMPNFVDVLGSNDERPRADRDGNGTDIDDASQKESGNDERPVADAAPDVAERDGTCASGCGDKRVFVTAQALPNGGFGNGSVAEADRFCQAAADERRFGGTWKAWISDSHTSPEARFAHTGAAYRLLDGTMVASSWADLTTGKLVHAIDLMDSGMWVPTQAYLEVWTGTAPNGSYSGHTCADWTNTSPDLPYADVGTVGRKDNGWTQAYRQFCDRENIHLYCFEQ